MERVKRARYMIHWPKPMDSIKKRYIIRIFEFEFDCLREDQIIFKFEVFDSNLILAFFRSLLERGLFGDMKLLADKKLRTLPA